jgi:enoyl-CoA hydratase
MRRDRASAYGSFDRTHDEAMQREFLAGIEILEAEAIPGAQRFVDGKGRGGSFEDL